MPRVDENVDPAELVLDARHHRRDRSFVVTSVTTEIALRPS